MVHVAVLVLIGAAVILLPIIVSLFLQRSRAVRRTLWSLREHEYPMPQPEWTVADLHRAATHALADSFTDPRWDKTDESRRLRELIARLDAEEPTAPLTPRDVDAWLAIRDLRGT